MVKMFCPSSRTLAALLFVEKSIDVVSAKVFVRTLFESCDRVDALRVGMIAFDFPTPAPLEVA